jgi:hypothetical protein
LVERLYGEGIVARRGAFTASWVDRLGPERYYVEIHPERLRGFVELATHPWVTGLCEAVLGRDYEIVEVGFDIPFPGAANQPWHRDFPAPVETTEHRRLTSLAFNVTTVDVEPEMGPLEIAPGPSGTTIQTSSTACFHRGTTGRGTSR